MKNKTCYILVGVPASGKSTWVEAQMPDYDDQWVASTDSIIEEIGNLFGLSYNEIFSDVIRFAEKQMWRDLKAAAKTGDTIYVDRTNLNSSSRKKFIDFLKPYGYQFKAIVLPQPDETEWHRRLNSREGKTIPAHVLRSMQDNYEVPLLSEGFDEIIYVNEQ